MRKSSTQSVSFWKTGEGISFILFAVIVTPLIVGTVLTIFGIL